MGPRRSSKPSSRTVTKGLGPRHTRSMPIRVINPVALTSELRPRCRIKIGTGFAGLADVAWYRRVIPVVLTVVFVGCSNPTAPALGGEPSYRELVEVLSPEVASHVDPSTGRFVRMWGDSSSGHLELS